MEEISLKSLLEMEQSEQRQCSSRDIVIARNSQLIEQWMRQHTEPLFLPEPRLLRIVSGSMSGRVNLEDVTLHKHDVLLMPPGSILEPQFTRDEGNTEAVIVTSLPGIPLEMRDRLLPHGIVLLHLNDDDWLRQSNLISSLDQLLAKGLTEAASHVMVAMLIDLQHLEQAGRQTTERGVSRGEETFHRFLRLAYEHGYRERHIAFYANELNLTPNHLSAIVRQQSQRTVLDFLWERTLTEAQILLRHTQLMIYEIAMRLGFPEQNAFARFFKKHTGMTPLKYRERR